MNVTVPACGTLRELRDAVACGEAITLRTLCAKHHRAAPHGLAWWDVRQRTVTYVADDGQTRTVRLPSSWLAPVTGHVRVAEVIVTSGEWVRVFIRTRRATRTMRDGSERVYMPGTVWHVDRQSKRREQTGDPRKGRIALRGVYVMQSQPRHAGTIGTMPRAASPVPDATGMHGLARAGGSAHLAATATVTSHGRKGAVRIVRQGTAPVWTGEHARSVPQSSHAGPIRAAGAETRDDDIAAMAAHNERIARERFTAAQLQRIKDRRATRDSLAAIARASAARARELAKATAARCGTDA